MSLSDKFEELEQVLLEHRHLLGLHTGVPFILLIYDPKQERACRSHQLHLREKLEAREVRVIDIELNTFVFDYYDKQGQLQHIFELDRDPARRDELRRMIASIYEGKLVQQILEQVQGKDTENTVIFLTGVASMYPFARVSNLLTVLENKVKIPLVVFYPGSEENGKLSFLNREPHIGYRARRI